MKSDRNSSRKTSAFESFHVLEERLDDHQRLILPSVIPNVSTSVYLQAERRTKNRDPLILYDAGIVHATQN